MKLAGVERIYRHIHRGAIPVKHVCAHSMFAARTRTHQSRQNIDRSPAKGMPDELAGRPDPVQKSELLPEPRSRFVERDPLAGTVRCQRLAIVGLVPVVRPVVGLDDGLNPRKRLVAPHRVDFITLPCATGFTSHAAAATRRHVYCPEPCPGVALRVVFRTA